MQVDGNSPERLAPLHHRSVILRVGDRDRRDAAQSLQHIDCGVVDQGKTLPQHVACRRVRKDRALPYAECRGGLDRRKPGRETAELVAVRVPKPLQGGPALA